MGPSEKQITVAVSVVLQDAGEATRSLEIMRAVREAAPEGYGVRGVFFSHGGRFEKNALESGFEILHTKPALAGEGYLADLKPGPHDFVGDAHLAAELLKGEIAALRECRPDVVLHGFWPFAGLARRMVEPNIPGICFLPLPLAPSLFGPKLIGDVPDQAKPLTFLPAAARRKLVRAVPPALLRNIPMMRQNNIRHAAAERGWRGEPVRNLFDMLKADLTVVNDFAGFYADLEIPEGYVITGPLYAAPEDGGTVDPEIAGAFRRETDGQVNIFCSMGSSGRKELLLEAVKAIATLPQERFRAVILAPKAVCPVEEVIPLVSGRPGVLVTDRFVPARLVNAMADVAVIHGGQGTVQTAVASGCPAVGVAMQPEQQINLEHIARRGAAVRIPAPRWNRRAVNAAIRAVAAEDSYKTNAARLAREMSETNGRAAAAEAIWRFLLDRTQSC